MKRLSFMFIAGEPSGDLLAAELAVALRQKIIASRPVISTDSQPLRSNFAPVFFGAGGQNMAAAGVRIAVEMTKHSVVGLSDVLKSYPVFRQLFRQLKSLAIERQPDVIVCVDFSGFNRRFAHAIREYTRSRQDWFHNWNPKIVQYVSPQVWASRPGRARQMAKDYDLLLSILPFEKEWYAQRAPELRVEFVGHPLVERFKKPDLQNKKPRNPAASGTVLLLPGSRPDELRRHVPLVLDAFLRMTSAIPGLRAKLILPNDELAQRLKQFAIPANVSFQVGELHSDLLEADLALTKSGTVTLECAFVGTPAVVFYKTSWPTYFVGRLSATVKYLAMPNLLANEEIYPEFIQHAATPENLAQAGLKLLQDEPRRKYVKSRLAQVVESLGGPGASARAAEAILQLLS